MKTYTRNLFACLLLFAAAGTVPGATLTFDDLVRGSQVGEGYAHLGVHFSLTDAGVQEGLANGDSGSWRVDGTSGPSFVGFNGLAPATYSVVLTFDSRIMVFDMDASRTFGSSAGDTLTASGFLGAVLVDSETITFGNINQWAHLALTGQIDRVVWTGTGLGFHPFGVDNVAFSAVPEPGVACLVLGTGLLWGGFRRTIKRRSHDNRC